MSEEINKEQQETKLISRRCPSCGAIIKVEDPSKPQYCMFCENTNITEPLTSESGKANTNQNSQDAIEKEQMKDIKNASSARIYLEDYFEKYDWESFNYYTNIITINNIDTLVKNIKLANAADYQTWILEFRSIIVPVKYKIDGLSKISDKIVDIYRSEDSEETIALSEFDNYCDVVKVLIKRRDEIIKTLETDLVMAKKLDEKAQELESLNKEFKEFCEYYKNVKVVKNITDLNKVKEFLAEKEASLVKRLKEAGIDAQEVYNEALYNIEQENFHDAMQKLMSIAGFKNSEELIQKYNRYYLQSSLLNICGKFYFFQRTKKTYELNISRLEDELKDKKQSVVAAPPHDHIQLFEIIDGKLSEKPIIEKIEQIIRNYGDILYYFKDRQTLCAYNFKTKEDKIISITSLEYIYKVDENGRYRDYLTKNKTQYFFLEKVLHQNSKTAQEVNLNNYHIVMLDLVTQKVKQVVTNIVDVVDYFEDCICYTTIPLRDYNEVSELPEFMIYYINKDETEHLFNLLCQVHHAENGKVFYTVAKNNEKNGDLYYMEITDKENPHLIETNVYTVERVDKNIVLYTVGSATRCSLISKDIKTMERHQVLKYAKTPRFVQNGWLYFTYFSDNSTLMKVKMDGTARVILSDDFKKFATKQPIRKGYLYYIDQNDYLCRVRLDGAENKELASDIGEIVHLSDDKIFYLQNESAGNYPVVSSVTLASGTFAYRDHIDLINQKDNLIYNYDKKSRMSKSLYSADLNGDNIKKLFFDVQSAEYFEGDIVNLVKDEVINYMRSRGTTFQVWVRQYIQFDLSNEESQLIVTVGEPTPEYFKKKGCKIFKKNRGELLGYQKITGVHYGYTDLYRNLTKPMDKNQFDKKGNLIKK